MLPKLVRCTQCKGFDVYADAWVGCNDSSDILGPYDTFHCVTCDGECSVEDVVMVPAPELVPVLNDAENYINNATLDEDTPPTEDITTLLNQIKESES